MKSMLKSELAREAGVSVSTFRRWLTCHRTELEKLGLRHNAKIIPPVAVKYICREFGIDLLAHQ